MKNKIDFINLETGNIFNGESPYIFWLDGGYSIGLRYTKHICFVSNKKHHFIKMNNSDVFKLIDINLLPHTQDEIVNNISYKNLDELYCEDKYISVGYKYDKLYIHNIYIVASSQSIGTFIDNFYIDDDKYSIGIDVYGENEELRINLSNFGLEISDSIQKAIYTNNIHEDNTDHILLNRKFKELLSNYWDVIANKGSYKSLINSLKWFEWGDGLRIRELWKSVKDGKLYDKELNSILDSKYKDQLYNFTKTTYIALYYSLQNIMKDNNGTIVYDEEKNPMLSNIVERWSWEDLSLKLSLLGSFYEYYFMPIHLDLIHSTIESIVYTNTFKVSSGGVVGRFDYIYNNDAVWCNINKDSIFKLTNTAIQVDRETSLYNSYSGTYEDTYKLGVRPVAYAVTDDEELKIIHSQHFNGVGVMVPITLYIPLRDGDVIKRINMTLMPDGKNNWVTKTFNMITNKKEFEFNLLCTEMREYEIRLEFLTIDSKVYVKKLNFKTVDTTNMNLDIYKIISWDGEAKFNNHRYSYMFSRYKNDQKYYDQVFKLNKNSNGPKLSNVLIIKDLVAHDRDPWIMNNYYTSIKDLSLIKVSNKTIYTVCVSKYYDFKPTEDELKPYEGKIYRNDYGFFPRLHKLESFGGDRLEDYTIEDDVLYIVPEFKFGKEVVGCEWEFINVTESINKKISYTIPGSIQTPMVLFNGNTKMLPGYYNIIFRFSFVDGQTHELILNSAFLKK